MFALIICIDSIAGHKFLYFTIPHNMFRLELETHDFDCGWMLLQVLQIWQ